MPQFKTLACFILIVFASAGLGGWFTSLGVGDWYKSLAKPAWTPPGWLFGPVWTVLYVMIAISGALIWQQPAARRRLALGAWTVQMILNVLWSACFFSLKQPGLAVLDIAALWLAILATMICSKPFSAPACWLLLPYLGWVSFAAALNVAIWRLN